MRGLQYFPSKVHWEKLRGSAKKEEVQHVRKPEPVLGSRADILASTLLQFSTAGAAQDNAHEILYTAQSDYVFRISQAFNGDQQIKKRVTENHSLGFIHRFSCFGRAER